MLIFFCCVPLADLRFCRVLSSLKTTPHDPFARHAHEIAQLNSLLSFGPTNPHNGMFFISLIAKIRSGTTPGPPAVSVAGSLIAGAADLSRWC